MVLQQSSIRFTRRNSQSQLVRGANHFVALSLQFRFQVLPNGSHLMIVIKPNRLLTHYLSVKLCHTNLTDPTDRALNAVQRSTFKEYKWLYIRI